MKIVLATALAGVLAAGAATAQTRVMKISNPVVHDVSNDWMRRLKEGVEKRSAGALRVELYPANQLGQIPATVEGVAMGTIEATVASMGFLIGLEPRFQVFDAAGLFDSVEHGQQVIRDAAIRGRTAQFGAAKGVEPLIIWAASPLMLLTHRPVRTLADFKGQKIRAPGGTPLHMEPLRKLGANPLSMPLGETLPAMQNRTIDGLIAGLAAYSSFKYHDVSKNMTQLPGSFLVSAALVNRTFLRSLGPELERAVREESRKAEVVFEAQLTGELRRQRTAWEANGGRLNVFSAEEQKQYIDEVSVSVRQLLASNPAVREDYEALLAAAARHRK